ncbi:MAG: DUF4240 domain-containing protein [Arenimonas sp.]
MSHIAFPDSIPDEFWQIIEEAGQDRAKFREILEKMNRGKMIRFFWTYEELATRIRGERYYQHADPDLSEDGVAELANWVVAQGREYYRHIFEHPEKIPAKKNDAGFMSDVVVDYEDRYSADLPINTHLWDDDWKSHGKKNPWSFDSE